MFSGAGPVKAAGGFRATLPIGIMSHPEHKEADGEMHTALCQACAPGGVCDHQGGSGLRPIAIAGAIAQLDVLLHA